MTLKNGYYLSTYVEINDYGNVYGFSLRHDQNISLWKKEGENVKLVHYWELERVSGLKQHRISFYDLAHAQRVINELLSEYQLSLDDMVEVWGTPELQTSDDYHSIEDLPEFMYHSICHLFSGVLFDTEKFYKGNILAFAVDLGADTIVDNHSAGKYEYSGCYVQEGRISYFPVMSPAMLWGTAKLRFKLKEGTLMALASASKSELLSAPPKGLCINDSSIDRDKVVRYFDDLEQRLQLLSEADRGIQFNLYDDHFTEEENKVSMAIKEINAISIEMMEANIDKAIQEHNIDPKETYLSITGGFALNCPTNSYLMKKYGFKGFIAPPCVSDTGQSLGIALYAFYKKMGRLSFCMEHGFYGDHDTGLQELVEGPYEAYIENINEFDADAAVDDIRVSPVVWFTGGAEVGPRALGHRSIIADPSSESAKNQLNIIKKRQWWRPVAPIIAEEEVNKWFEDAYPTPFMLHTFRIKQDKLAHIPAIAHLDGSARIQTLNSSDPLHRLLQSFKEKTGIPIICNTSLNDNSEPIINRLEEALNFALRKGIRIAYLNGKRVVLKNHQAYQETKPLKRKEHLWQSEDDLEGLKKKMNPYNVSKEALVYYALFTDRKDYNLQDPGDARALSLYVKSFIKNVDLEEVVWH